MYVGVVTKEFMQLDHERELLERGEVHRPKALEDLFRANEREKEATAAAVLTRRVEELTAALEDAEERIAQLEAQKKNETKP